MELNVISELSHGLHLSGRRRRAIARELQAHLDETRRELEAAGWTHEDAERESVARFGDPREIAEGFGQVYRPARAKRIGLSAGLACTLLAGAWGVGGSLASATPAHRAPAPAHIRTHAVTTPHSCPHHSSRRT